MHSSLKVADNIVTYKVEVSLRPSDPLAVSTDMQAQKLMREGSPPAGDPLWKLTQGSALTAEAVQVSQDVLLLAQVAVPVTRSAIDCATHMHSAEIIQGACMKRRLPNETQEQATARAASLVAELPGPLCDHAWQSGVHKAAGDYSQVKVLDGDTAVFEHTFSPPLHVDAGQRLRVELVVLPFDDVASRHARAGAAAEVVAGPRRIVETE